MSMQWGLAPGRAHEIYNKCIQIPARSQCYSVSGTGHDSPMETVGQKFLTWAPRGREKKKKKGETAITT